MGIFGKINSGTIVTIIFVAIGLLYLFSKLVTTTTGADGTTYAFNPPGVDDVSGIGLFLLKLIILGAATWLAMIVVGMFAGGASGFGRKQIFVIAILAVVVYFVWQYIAGPIFNADSLDNITLAVGTKAGFFKP